MPLPVAPSSFPLTTERLVLRPYEPGDVEPLLAYYGDPEVARYLLTGVFSRPDAEEAVAKRVQRNRLAEPGDALALVVEHEGVVVGDLVLMLEGPPLGVGEIGWVFHPDHGGRGFATEAARALLALAFDTVGLHRVKAQLDARNVTSQRLCDRLGMRREAHLRCDWFSKGEWTDTLVYGMLAEEWRAQTQPAS